MRCLRRSTSGAAIPPAIAPRYLDERGCKLGLKHLSGWERMAVVSDVEWIRAAVKIFGLAMPGHVRVFHHSELAEAKRRITE
jgi:hypothetical protein